MVNVGFICEGYTELFILKSEKFQRLLGELSIHSVGILNSEGNGNLLPGNIEKHSKILQADGAETIVILTDLDEDQCVSKTKARIGIRDGQHIVIAVKQIEAWFLADTETMKSIMKGNFFFQVPEIESVPFETIHKIYFDKFLKGFVGQGDKKKLARKMLDAGFSVQNAAAHPNCSSARYFLDKLKKIVDNQD